MSKTGKNANGQKSPNGDKEYYVNIDGKPVKVDVNSDEEYSCLLNCLEGYYIYGAGSDDEEDENDNDNDSNSKV